jgi:hypothetical protein
MSSALAAAGAPDTEADSVAASVDATALDRAAVASERAFTLSVVAADVAASEAIEMTERAANIGVASG